jgi:hypothetical protein
LIWDAVLPLPLPTNQPETYHYYADHHSAGYPNPPTGSRRFFVQSVLLQSIRLPFLLPLSLLPFDNVIDNPDKPFDKEEQYAGRTNQVDSRTNYHKPVLLNALTDCIESFHVRLPDIFLPENCSPSGASQPSVLKVTWKYPIFPS